MRQHRGEEGVSEVVGTILLVGLTVLAVAVVAVVFLSGPQPDEIPHATIVAGNKSGSLVLTHEGGDPLRAGEYRIYVDTGSGLVERTGDFSKPEGGIWSIGESIDYTGTETLKRVVVTVISGGSETILSELAFVKRGTTFSPDPVEPGDTNGDDEPEESFIDFVINKSVFVYGTTLSIGEGGGGGGTTVTGPGATVVITEGLKKEDLGRGGLGIAVSHIYIDGDVTLDGGDAGIGSEIEPGNVSVNGNLKILGGQRNIYGNLYVNGSCDLEGVRMHNNVYVNGDLTLRRADTDIKGNARAYYTGAFATYDHVPSNIIEKCNQTAVPKLDMPDFEFPSAKSAEWYAAQNYKPTLTNTRKVYAPSYTASGSASNIIVVAYNGDISVGGGGTTVTGVFFAPKGKVTFNGDRFEGLVIARDGFFVTSGGTEATFRAISHYIDNPDDYPF